MIHSMVAHLDAVTSLAVDPNGLYLLSGSKFYISRCDPVVSLTKDGCSRDTIARFKAFLIGLIQHRIILQYNRPQGNLQKSPL